MYCKWCGMESLDETKCDWCKRPFPTPASAQATTAVPPVTTSLPPRSNYPPPGTRPAPQQPTVVPASAAPGVPAPGMPYAQDPRLAAPPPLVIERNELPPFGERMEKYLSIMTLALAAAMLFAHYFPDAWLAPFFLLLFVSGLLLGVFRVIGYYDYDYSDVLIFLVAAAFLSPVYAIGVYLLIGAVKREVNVSMLGLIASFIVIRLMVGSAAHGIDDTLGHMLHFTVALGLIDRILQLLPMCLLFGGWMAASFTRPLNE